LKSDSDHRIRTVLFDLDGTLLDTAPDLAFALNRIRDEEGLEPLPLEVIRTVVSHGGRALIQLGFDLTPDHPEFDHLRKRLLSTYRDNLARETRLFPGMESVLDIIERHGMNWGVVTNKPAFLTEPLLKELNLSHRAACIVSGDTVEHSKPHVAPMLAACEQAGSSAAECVYVGDAQRDVQAGQNAGMHTLVALFGYFTAQDEPGSWGADGLVNDPMEIVDWLDRLQAEN